MPVLLLALLAAAYAGPRWPVPADPFLWLLVFVGTRLRRERVLPWAAAVLLVRSLFSITAPWMNLVSGSLVLGLLFLVRRWLRPAAPAVQLGCAALAAALLVVGEATALAWVYPHLRWLETVRRALPVMAGTALGQPLVDRLLVVLLGSTRRFRRHLAAEG